MSTRLEATSITESIPKQPLSTVFPVPRQCIFCCAPSFDFPNPQKQNQRLISSFSCHHLLSNFIVHLHSAQRKSRGIFLNRARRDLFGAVRKFYPETH